MSFSILFSKKMKQLKYRIEAFFAGLLFAAFRALPVDVASFIGGMMARSIGPFLSAHKTARNNLKMIFPDKTEDEIYQIIMRMWDNLGRVAGELPHLPGNDLYSHMTVHGLENLPKDGKPSLFFSGHIGNWELTYPMAHQNGIRVTAIYRQANNPYVDKIVNDIRATQAAGMFPKGPKGAIKMGRALKNGETMAMLVDQKMNEGISVPFFGRDAMTAPAIAEFSLRYNMPIIPVRIVRRKGCNFDGYIFPPLKYEQTGDKEKDLLAIMTQINAMLEEWIREYPEQWFWVHKRWPK